MPFHSNFGPQPLLPKLPSDHSKIIGDVRQVICSVVVVVVREPCSLDDSAKNQKQTRAHVSDQDQSLRVQSKRGIHERQIYVAAQVLH